jgi:hypothetical protein
MEPERMWRVLTPLVLRKPRSVEIHVLLERLDAQILHDPME